MIPKIIHQIWFQGKSKCPNKFLKNSKTWIDKNENYEYIFWDENSINNFLQQNYPQYLNNYKNFNYMHQKIDFFKYILMNHYGGIYADIDTICLQNFDNLLKYDGVVVCETMANKFESFITFGQQHSVNNGVILSEKHHPFWLWYINNIFKQKGPWLTKFSEINNTTGPSFFSKCIYSYKGEGITILNHHAFEPCYSGDIYCKVDNKSYADHQHAQTWISPIVQYMTKIYYTIKHYIWWLLVVFIFLYLNKNYN